MGCLASRARHLGADSSDDPCRYWSRPSAASSRRAGTSTAATPSNRPAPRTASGSCRHGYRAESRSPPNTGTHTTPPSTRTPEHDLKRHRRGTPAGDPCKSAAQVDSRRSVTSLRRPFNAGPTTPTIASSSITRRITLSDRGATHAGASGGCRPTRHSICGGLLGYATIRRRSRQAPRGGLSKR